MTIGERIKNRREELEMSQSELAEKLGLKGKSSISKIEKAGDHISTTSIALYAKALNTTPAKLMGYEAEHSVENAELLGSLMHNKDILELVKKIMALDEKKKEALYSYVDFLSSH